LPRDSVGISRGRRVVRRLRSDHRSPGRRTAGAGRCAARGHRAMNPHMPSTTAGDAPAREQAAQIPAGRRPRDADLAMRAEPAGLVVFGHGSGSSRRSPRNHAVARTLHRAGMGTLLIDLLTEAEADERSNVFDIALLAERLAAAAQ